MTRSGYLVRLVRKVSIAALKARLSEYVRNVRKGRSFLVVSRDVPVARLVPVEEGARLRVRPRSGPKVQDVALPPPLAGVPDALLLLREERQGER